MEQPGDLDSGDQGPTTDSEAPPDSQAAEHVKIAAVGESQPKSTHRREVPKHVKVASVVEQGPPAGPQHHPEAAMEQPGHQEAPSDPVAAMEQPGDLDSGDQGPTTDSEARPDSQAAEHVKIAAVVHQGPLAGPQHGDSPHSDAPSASKAVQITENIQQECQVRQLRRFRNSLEHVRIRNF